MRRSRLHTSAGISWAGGILLFWLCGPAAALPTGTTVDHDVDPATGQHRIVVHGPVFTVDQIYRSMRGPYDTVTVTFPQTDKEEAEPRLIWITGYDAAMVSPDGTTEMPPEFMCHSNLDFNMDALRESFGDIRHNSDRVFTLSQGQLSLDLPEGFGIPVMSDDTLNLTVQMLNLNHKGEPVSVRHRVTLRYRYDDELNGRPIQPLFTSWAQGLVLIDGPDGYYGVAEPDAETHGPGCAVGTPADADPYEDDFGRRFSGHWVVPPGRQENHSLNTQLMNIPFPTTIHYIAVHLHPFAESIELIDRTTGESLFKSRARNYPDRIGLDHVDSYASPDGIPVYPDHEYEVVTVYNNTSGEDQDSMAVLYFYLADHAFKRPEEEEQDTDDAGITEPPRQRGTVF